MSPPTIHAVVEAARSALDADPSSRVLLLSCIDFRYPRRILDTMEREGLTGRYFHLALAGASHGAQHDPTWAKTFNDHLDFVVERGGVTGVVVLDHLDCAAYHAFEATEPGDLEGERARHREVAASVVQAIVERHPRLEGRVYALLLPAELEPEPIGGA